MRPSRLIPLSAALGLAAYLFASVPQSFARGPAPGELRRASPPADTPLDAPRDTPRTTRTRPESGEEAPVEPDRPLPREPARPRPGEPTPRASSRPHRTCEAREPAWIWCDDFEDDRLGRYFEYDDAGGSFVREEDVGVGGSWGMRATFRQGQVDAGSLKLAFGRTPQRYMRPVDAGERRYREVFWRFYLRREPGWRGGGGDKLSRATSFVAPDSWAQAMIAHVWSGAPPWEHHLVADPASGTDRRTGIVLTNRYNDFDNLRWLGAARGPTLLFDRGHAGRWTCIEAHVRLNDPGASNGLFEIWVDGRPEARVADLDWVGAFDEYGVNAVFLENYWNAGSPARQSRYLDDFVVSTERVGCDLPAARVQRDP